jgi:DUF1365 family protein
VVGDPGCRGLRGALVIPEPGIYVGTLRHRRFSPTPHAFTYSIFMPLLDVDRIPELMAVSRMTSYNGRNLAAFDDRDHFGDPTRSLRARIEDSADGAGVALPDGPIFLLTHLRYAGYAFNPISLYYCYERAGRLTRVLAEVNNTYGGRQLYWLTRDAAGGPSFRARVAKALYVSPFIAAEVDYGFSMTAPGESLIAHMDVHRSQDPVADVGPSASPPRVLDATLSLRRRPWTAGAIRFALLRFPLMTTKVIASIHWQALRLYLKGVPVVPRLVANGEGERAAQERRRRAGPGETRPISSAEEW